MSLKNIIDKEIKKSMFQKNKNRLIALRAIKAAILLEEKSGSSNNFNENQLLMKLIKQRKDSLTLYKEQNRSDLAIKEEEEINKYINYCILSFNLFIWGNMWFMH